MSRYHSRNSKRTKKIMVTLLGTILLLLIASAVLNAFAGPQPIIWTDKADYHPEETVTIFGIDFNSNAQVTVSVTRPDSHIDSWTVASDEVGSFTTTYLLDGIFGSYSVSASDGTNPAATTTFTDAPPAANIDQVRNGDEDAPVSPGNWVNGNVGDQQGHYIEGYSIPYRVTMTDLPLGATIMITLEYDIRHSSRNAIDYLTNYSLINTPSHQLVFGHPPEVIDPLIGVAGVSGPNTTYTIPPPGQSSPGDSSYANLVGNYSTDAVQMWLFGGTITNIQYWIKGDLTAAQSSTSINVTFIAGSATEVLAWGGHIASRDDWGFTNGVPNSAGGISGSPYHMRLIEWTLVPPPEKSSDNLPNLGNQDRSLSAAAVFAPSANPNITLTKTPSSTKVENGSMVTYTYNVTNTGDVSLNVSLVDDQFGTLFTNKTMVSGESNITTITVPLTVNTTNVANATGVYPLTSASVNATASASVTVLHPAISLTKTPSSTKVENGANVTYTFVVTNTGDTSLTVGLVDSQFGTIFSGKLMAPGAVNTTVLWAILTSNTTNVATATGVDQLATSVNANASATVTVLHPAISLTKTPSSTKVENGSSVTYTYNTTNTGDTPLTVSLVDNIYGSLFTGKVLNPGQSNVTTIVRTLTVNTTNIATATGVDQLATSVQAQATATVHVLHPAISLTKTPSSTKVENGASVTYTYNTTNTGDTPLTVSLVDNMFGTIFTGKVLNPGVSNITTVIQTLNANTTNTATATGVDQLATSVQAQASAFVHVIHPDISLTKTPSSTKVEDGASVTYTYVTANTGDTPLTVSLVDNVYGTLFTGKVLNPGQSNTTTIVRTLTVNTTNTATATGVDQLATQVTAQATAFVHVIHPDISLTKTTSSTKVENGSSVTYTYVTTNTGDTPLTVSLVDNVYGTLFTGKVLNPGQSNTTTIVRTLTVNTTNTATATGVDQLATQVTAQATAFVHVIHPDISLTKTPSSTKVENGSSVTYTYVTTNTGDTPLTVSLVDNVYGTLFTGKVLNPGQSNTTTIVRTLTVNTTNTATATGVDQLATQVTAQASATVTVIHPSLTLTKTPSSTKVESGASVTYTYVVTNTGDTPLTVNLVDNQFGTIFTGKVLAPGASNTTTIVRALTVNTTNIATATAVDQAGGPATATATATVTVLHPAISLTKTPSSTKVENGSSVTYTYNTTNIGDTPLTVSLVDNVYGTLFTGKILNPGESNITIIVQTLTVNTTNTATATGVDQLATQVTAQATAFVHVIHPAISLTKTPSVGKALNTTAITYTYNVTNTGDTPLTVSLVDNVYGTLWTGKVMAPGESNITTIVRTFNQTTTNTATATGVDQLATTVTATASATVTIIHPAIRITKDCEPHDQLAPGNITWTVRVTNIGDVPLTNINITETRSTIANFSFAGPLAVGGTITIIATEVNLPPGTYYNNATVVAAHQLGTVSAWDDAQCVVRPVFILKQFTGVTVLPIGIQEGFNATLVNGTNVNVYGTKSGPKIYFNITYYFENSLNFLGDSFDGQAHNFTLWDKWGGNLMALGSPPVAFSQTSNNLTLADGSYFNINPKNSGPGTYRGYIGSGLDISNLASQGEAWITMHLGDQQNTTNPGKGKGTGNDGQSYDSDTVWHIGELGVNQSATLTLFIAPGKNPGGQLEFTSLGCTVINTGPRVRAYGDTYDNEDFLYAVERTNTLTVCVFPKVT